MRKALGVLIVAMTAAAPAWAGLTFTQVIKNEGGKGRGPGDSSAQVWLEGGQAKMVFEQSSNPMFTPGTYMLINEKGEMIFVNPDKKTYGKFDVAAMMESLNQVMGGAAKFGFKLEIENPKIEKDLEEPGGQVLGYPTTHYRWHTSYTTVFRMPKPMRDRRHETNSTEDVWTTTAIQLPPATGNALQGLGGGGAMTEELRKLVDVEQAKMTGFPLKRVTVTTTADGDNTQMTTEITEIKKADVPASTFAIPPGYTEVDMMQPQRGPAMPNLNGR